MLTDPDNELSAHEGRKLYASAAVLESLTAFFRRIPLEDRTDRTDRRHFRWVLCGEHGFVRNHREACPDCGGYAEPLRNHAMAGRLERRRRATARLIKLLSKARRPGRKSSAA